MFGLLAATGLLALFGNVVVALRLPALKAREATRISASTLAGYAPFTQFARATYCDVDALALWDCGEACAANQDFKPSLAGGDGNAIQKYFVGYWPGQDAVVVAHEGTDPEQLLADLTDINLFMETLDSDLFPGVSSDVLVHSGFADEQQKTAITILKEIQNQLSSSNASTVVVVGHSLGGALSELDAVFFKLHLPSSVHVKAVTYGTPRVGNAAWAALVDSAVPDFVRINNKKDPVPIVLSRLLGYQHPHGEIHISNGTVAFACPGDEDTMDAQCSDSQVPNLAASNVADHLGPYDGIYLGTDYCT